MTPSMPASFDSPPGQWMRWAFRKQIVWYGCALVAFVAALMGIYYLSSEPGDSSTEATFARDMAAHHTQAVTMALAIRDRTTNRELRFFTLDIMLTQQAQLGQMHGWLAAWRLPIGGAGAPMGGMGEMMGMASQQQVNSLGTLPLSEAEVAFLQLMIRHHQGGVLMAQDVLQKTTRPEVVRLASAIVAGQQSEITTMEQMLTERNAQPFAPLQPMQMHDMH